MRKENFIKKWLQPCDLETLTLYDAYKKRFFNEYDLLFEHCSSYINRLITDSSKKKYLLNTEEKNLALIHDNIVEIFVPVLKPSEFASLYKDSALSGFKLSLRDLSKEYLEVNDFLISGCYKYNIAERSKDEVILSTTMLSNLNGGDFSKLRNLIKRYEKDESISYREAIPSDYEGVMNLIEIWAETQGKKYFLDRKASDIEYVNFYFNNLAKINLQTKIILKQNRVCGLSLIETVRNNLAVYLVNKCLNGIEMNNVYYGVSGLSKYLYYKTACDLNSAGTYFVNLGSIGEEEGARSAKESLKILSKRLVSYQINY